MARQRNYRAEYQRRLELGRVRGLVRQQARGHGQTPESPLTAFRHPERHLAYLQRNLDRARQRYDTKPSFRTAWEANNQRRMREGRAVLILGDPPGIAPRQARGLVEDLDEAERRVAGIPDGYRRIYVTRAGFVFEIDRSESRSRRRAA